MPLFSKINILRSKVPENRPNSIVETNNERQRYPFYIKAPLILIGIYLLFFMLQLLQEILVPICFAGLIAILLNPLVNKLIRWRVPRVLSISIAILLAIVVFGGIALFFGTQFAGFSELGPALKDRGFQLLQLAENWLDKTFHISAEKQLQMLKEAVEGSKAYIGQTVGTIVGIIGYIVLMPIYVFLLLYYKPLIINFFYEVFDSKHGAKISEVLTETKSSIQSYILGLLIETCIVAVLNSIALLVIGVKYAILLGVLGALLNLIPYIGGIIAIALPVLMSLAFGDMTLAKPIYIIIGYTVIQFIDNNVLVPNIVSSKVEVNAFVSIIIVLLGGALWGVSGMFLSIPFIAILKIIFDRIEELKPWGMLLGTNMDESFSLKDIENNTAENKSVINEGEENQKD